MKPTEFGLLPDGRCFDFWDCTTQFTKTYYVDNNNPNASDDNEGSIDSPFKTISKAAKIAEAGERVIIKGGIYRETVRPVNGGSGPDKMISFEGAEGENVVVTGAEDWNCSWETSSGYRQTPAWEMDELDLFSLDDSVYFSNNTTARVWMGSLTRTLFDGYNPFCVMNTSNVGWVPTDNSLPHIATESILKYVNTTPLLLKRGLLFCDGDLLKQVLCPHELWQQDGTYWVEDGGLNIHFRLKNDESPYGHHLEAAVRDQGFVPEQRGLGYVRVKNINFEKYSNPFFPPQKGAVSTNCGHHWIVEGCSINWVNTAGIDMGFLSHYVYQDGIRGGHIVRKNRIENCGICGICAVPANGRYLENMLVEDNVFSGNCWHEAEILFENAAVKNHYTKDCLYRRNIFMHTGYGTGIWLDKCINNTRICNNIFIDCKSTMYGAIFIEGTYDKVLVDNNFIWGVGCHTRPDGSRTGGHGIYEHEVDNLTITRNAIFNAEGTGVHCKYTPPAERRLIRGRRETFHRDDKVIENIIHNCSRAIDLPTANNFSDKNIFGNFTARDAILNILSIEEKHNLDSWQKIYGFDLNGYTAQITANLDIEKLIISLCFKTAIKQFDFNIDLNKDGSISNLWNEIL